MDGDQGANPNTSDTLSSKPQCITITQSPLITSNASVTLQSSGSEVRRQKMENVYRTLGEDVPQEFVFQSSRGELNMAAKECSKNDNEVLPACGVEWETSVHRTDVSVSISPTIQLPDHLPDNDTTSTPSPITDRPPDITGEMKSSPSTNTPPQFMVTVSHSVEHECATQTKEKGQ